MGSIRSRRSRLPVAGTDRHIMDGLERRNPLHPLRRPTDYLPNGERRRTWSRPERTYRLTSRRRPVLTFVATLLAVIMPATIVVAASQTVLRAPTGTSQKKQPKVEMVWAWSDGHDIAITRSFLASDYTKKPLPFIVMDVAPADRNRLIYWQFQQEGNWNDEYLVKAGKNGVARIPLDPFCEDTSWCEGEYSYRLKMGDHVSFIIIDFRES